MLCSCQQQQQQQQQHQFNNGDCKQKFPFWELWRKAVETWAFFKDTLSYIFPRLIIQHRAMSFWTRPHPHLSTLGEAFNTSRKKPKINSPPNGCRVGWRGERVNLQIMPSHVRFRSGSNRSNRFVSEKEGRSKRCPCEWLIHEIHQNFLLWSVAATDWFKFPRNQSRFRLGHKKSWESIPTRIFCLLI